MFCISFLNVVCRFCVIPLWLNIIDNWQLCRIEYFWGFYFTMINTLWWCWKWVATALYYGWVSENFRKILESSDQTGNPLEVSSNLIFMMRDSTKLDNTGNMLRCMPLDSDIQINSFRLDDVSFVLIIEICSTKILIHGNFYPINVQKSFSALVEMLSIAPRLVFIKVSRLCLFSTFATSKSSDISFCGNAYMKMYSLVLLCYPI